MLWQLTESRTIDDLLSALSRGREVYALEPADGGQYHLVKAAAWEKGKHTLGAYRPVEPLKSVVFRPRELLGPLTSASAPAPLPERIVIGVKNCDLSALQIHDYVLLKNEPRDPYYAEAREKTLLVSCDCTGCLDVCFCPVVGEQPHPKKGFDINLSPVSGGYLVEAGSARGEKALEGARDLLVPAGAGLAEKRDADRSAMTRRVTDQAATHGLKPGMDLRKAIQKSSESKLWEDFAEDCVECGAC
ncbi:MAG: hypothetical protein BWK77_08755, partial [Verrucomicrobia bacterium A1]